MKRCLPLLLLLLVPRAGWAQEAQAPAVPKGLQTDALPTAYVLDERGVETKGKLLQLDAKSVVLLVDGMQREFELARVSRVSQRGDSLKNGAITGAIVGVVMGSIAAGISDYPSGDGYGACGAGYRIAMVLGSTAIYTSIGVGVDAAIQGRRVLYQAPPRSASLTFRLTW